MIIRYGRDFGPHACNSLKHGHRSVLRPGLEGHRVRAASPALNVWRPQKGSDIAQFEDIFFKGEENAWLDGFVATRFRRTQSPHEVSLIDHLSDVFQADLF